MGYIIVLGPFPFLYGPTIQNFFSFQYHNQKFYPRTRFIDLFITYFKAQFNREKGNYARQIYLSFKVRRKITYLRKSSQLGDNNPW